MASRTLKSLPVEPTAELPLGALRAENERLSEIYVSEEDPPRLAGSRSRPLCRLSELRGHLEKCKLRSLSWRIPGSSGVSLTHWPN